MDSGRQKMWFGDAKRHYAHRRQTPKKILDGRWTPKKIPPRTPDAKPIPPLESCTGPRADKLPMHDRGSGTEGSIIRLLF